jgi:cytochrome P450
MLDDVTVSPAVPRPAHVPEHLVYDFDMFLDPAYGANPHARLFELHGVAPPIFWTPRQGGHWVLIGHEVNFNASRDWNSFTSQFSNPEQFQKLMALLPKDIGHIPTAVPINLDPPAHGIFRAPLNSVFSPKAALALRDSIRSLANELIDKVIASGRCDFMADIAEPLPVQVFLKLMGLPVERQAEYRTLVKDMLKNIGPDPIKSITHLQRIAAAMRDTMLERRDNPRDDLISLLWKTEINGQPVALEDMENYCVLLFIAGLDTVMNGMGFGICHLARDPSLQDQLRKKPELIEAAREELLRRYTFTVPTRIVAKDLVFNGVEMKQGERVMLFLPAADLDPKEFPNPERFDLARENNVHIAFATGPHRCLGSHLARVELQVIYEEMLARLPAFRLDPSQPPKFHCGNVVGVDSLHLVWTP